MDILELLQCRGLPVGKPKSIKLLRHKDARFDVKSLQLNGHLENYQKYQEKPVLDCDYIVSFIGAEGTKAHFLGVYKVDKRKDGKNVPPTPEGFPHPEFSRMPYYYELTELDGFSDFKGRVVIDWGKSTISWHQWLDPRKPKEIIEMLPHGYVGVFPGYLEILLSYSELQRIINNPTPNKVWHTLLREVGGVYLIVDGNTGKQYVGAAYGKEGILGRWKQYAQNGHGGNQQLAELLKSSPSYEHHFQFSILCTLPNAMTKHDVLEFEKLYKRKLGSRSHGLNSN